MGLGRPPDAPSPQIPIDHNGQTAPLPARDFVPWRFSDACQGSEGMVLGCRRPRNLHKASRFSAEAVNIIFRMAYRGEHMGFCGGDASKSLGN